jgi:hypothetical protein
MERQTLDAELQQIKTTILRQRSTIRSLVYLSTGLLLVIGLALLS